MEQLLLELLRGTTPGPGLKNPAGPGLTLLGTFLALAGAGFLLVAGYIWMLDHYDTRTASLYMGAGAMAGAALCAIIAGVINYSAKMKARMYRNAVIHKLQSTIKSVVAELDEPIQENPKTAALLAGLAGYVAAEKILH